MNEKAILLAISQGMLRMYAIGVKLVLYVLQGRLEHQRTGLHCKLLKLAIQCKW